jgi:hypothetical protein
MPGTEEKIRVMETRARAGLPLFHPEDAKLDQRDMPVDLSIYGSLLAHHGPARAPRTVNAVIGEPCD